MGFSDCFTITIRSPFDPFELAIAVIKAVKERLPQPEYHSTVNKAGGGPGYFHDPYKEDRLRLEQAKMAIETACEVAQDVLARIEANGKTT